MSGCGNYFIDWWSEFQDVQVTPKYYARCDVYLDRPGMEVDAHVLHDFVGARRPYRTLRAAVEACEKHEKLWKFAIQISEGDGRSVRKRLADAEKRARAGDARVLHYLPTWAFGTANALLLDFLYPTERIRDEEPDETPLAPMAGEEALDLTLACEKGKDAEDYDETDDSGEDLDVETVTSAPPKKKAVVKKPAPKAAKKAAPKKAAKKAAKKTAKKKASRKAA